MTRDVDALLTLDAEPDVEDGNDGTVPLEIANVRRNAGLVRSLLKRGANPDIKLVGGETSSWLAREQKDPEIFRLIETVAVRET